MKKQKEKMWKNLKASVESKTRFLWVALNRLVSIKLNHNVSQLRLLRKSTKLSFSLTRFERYKTIIKLIKI
jgi:hypothetical protein